MAGVPVDFEELNLDAKHEDVDHVQQVITSVRRNGVALKGNIETREHSKSLRSRNVELRLGLNLFANVIHCKSHPAVETRHNNIDIVLIRQNTEGKLFEKRNLLRS